MDIKSVVSSYSTVAYESSPKKDKAGNAKRPAGSTEVVAFSDESLNLKKVKDAAYKAPDIRLPIVEKIRAAIAKDSYPVDLKAQSALDEMLKNKLF